ncbi:MAG: hypothetical protein SGILL_008179, partial [Bacillariaceae sp.]
LSITTTLILVVLLLVTVVELAYLSSLHNDLKQQEFWNLWQPKTSIYTTSSFAFRNPIDDSYQRPHIREGSVPLIVGGSDGSGTRAFVQVLQDLGVQMVVEDQGTLDVHAWQLFGGEGWPGLVRRVLNVTHSPIYSLADLPDTLNAIAYADLGNMLSNIEVAADVLRQVKMDEGNRGSHKPHAAISFGFKAPVTMLLLPFFQKHLPAFKYLHIVRDGRDVAFSDNQSPVEKFYNVFYKDAKQRDAELLEEDFGFRTRNQIKAMQLWNDWNQAVYDYAKKAADGNVFDVLVVRSEDLLDHKYEALSKIADFVQSALSPQDICCLSRKGNKDIGKVQSAPGADNPRVFGAKDFEAIRGRFHDAAPNEDADADWGVGAAHQQWPDTGDWEDIRAKMLAQHQHDEKHQRRLSEIESKVHPGDNARMGGIDYKDLSHFLNRRNKLIEDTYKKPDAVRDRYGKWKDKLEGKPELERRLHQDGRLALETFGYEPRRVFMDVPGGSVIPPCDESLICQ